jgi:hypothetical protein
MCRKRMVVLLQCLCLVTSVGAGTVTWDFEDGNTHHFQLWSAVLSYGAEDPCTAGDELLTGVGGPVGLPSAGLAWSVGTPDQYDGLKPAVAKDARVDADGLLKYSLGPEYIPASSGTLNTFDLNQNGDWLNTPGNDQLATSPMIGLGEGAVLTVWSYGGGDGTHAPEYDPNPDNFYTDGSCGVAILSAEEADKWALLASLHTQGKGTLTESTLDLSALAGRRVYVEVVDAFDGDWGWLAIDKIEITNATLKRAAIIVQEHEGVMDGGFDAAQVQHLTNLGYDVRVVDMTEVTDNTFTTDDANEFDVVLASESLNSSNFVPLAGTTAGVMHQEAFGWWKCGYMNARTNIIWSGGGTYNIVNDTHPIVVDANVPLGPLTFYDPSCDVTMELASQLIPGAELIATTSPDGQDYALIFTIEKGVILSDVSQSAATKSMPAPSRIACFSLPGLFPDSGGPYDADRMTDEAWALYDATIRWLDSPAPQAAQ